MCVRVQKMPATVPSGGWLCCRCGRRYYSTPGIKKHAVVSHDCYFRAGDGKGVMTDIPPDEIFEARFRVRIAQAKARDRPGMRAELQHILEVRHLTSHQSPSGRSAEQKSDTVSLSESESQVTDSSSDTSTMPENRRKRTLNVVDRSVTEERVPSCSGGVPLKRSSGCRRLETTDKRRPAGMSDENSDSGSMEYRVSSPFHRSTSDVSSGQDVDKLEWDFADEPVSTVETVDVSTETDETGSRGAYIMPEEVTLEAWVNLILSCPSLSETELLNVILKRVPRPISDRALANLIITIRSTVFAAKGIAERIARMTTLPLVNDPVGRDSLKNISSYLWGLHSRVLNGFQSPSTMEEED